jgi:hypothetical protein
MVVIRMTYATSSTLEDTTGHGRCPPHQRLAARAPTPSSRGTFHTLATELKQVAWPDKFKHGPIYKYERSSNPEEFFQVYHTVIEATGGDDRVKANYLSMTLSGVGRSWLINLLEETIYNWDQLCVMFISNF